MAKKKKKGRNTCLIHYQNPNGIYDFKIVLKKKADRNVLELMVLGKKNIKYQK